MEDPLTLYIILYHVLPLCISFHITSYENIKRLRTIGEGMLSTSSLLKVAEYVSSSSKGPKDSSCLKET